MKRMQVRHPKTLALIGLALFLASVVATAHAATSGPVVVTVEYNVIGGAKGYSAPVLSYYLGGVLNSTVLVNQTEALLIDSGSKWSISATLPGSNSTFRWATPTSMGTARAGLVNVTYYFQVQVSLLVATVDGGKAAPVVNYTEYGQTLFDKPSGQAVWLDYRSQYNYSSSETTSRPGERYLGVGTLSGNATSPGSVTATYFHQWLVTANYTMSGGSGLKSPTFMGVAEGSTVSMPLFTNSTQVWLDSGSQFNATQQVAVSPNERWSMDAKAGTVSSDLNLTFSYYLQYTLTSSYEVLAGHSPSQPVLNFTSYGGGERIASMESPVTVWADAGSNFAMNVLLQGSSGTERWVSTGDTSGTLDSPTVITPVYYHQYLVQIGYSLQGNGSPGAPVLTFVSLGVGQTLTPSYQALWADGGSRLLLTEALAGAPQGARWELGNQVPGVVSAPIRENVTYYLQVEATITLQVNGGGNLTATYGALTRFVFTYLGRPMSPEVQNATYWLDSGSPWSVTPVVQGGLGERWILVGENSSGSATAPFSLSLSYQHQYQVVASLGSPGGQLMPNPTGWYDNGAQVEFVANSSSGWEFGYWGGNQNLTTSSGTLTITGFTNETAVFYPGVTISAESGGSVKVVGDISSGIANSSKPFVAYETPGSTVTLYATPSSSISQFNSWTGNETGNQNPLKFVVNAPVQVSAAFGLSTFNVLAVVGGVALVVICVFMAFPTLRKRPKAFLNDVLGRIGLGGR